MQEYPWTEDDDQAAAAHQVELENRQYEEDEATLTADPYYLTWLDMMDIAEEMKWD